MLKFYAFINETYQSICSLYLSLCSKKKHFRNHYLQLKIILWQDLMIINFTCNCSWHHLNTLFQWPHNCDELSVPSPSVYIECMCPSRFLLAYGKSLFIYKPRKGRIKRSDTVSYPFPPLSLPERGRVSSRSFAFGAAIRTFHILQEQQCNKSDTYCYLVLKHINGPLTTPTQSVLALSPAQLSSFILYQSDSLPPQAYLHVLLSP